MAPERSPVPSNLRSLADALERLPGVRATFGQNLPEGWEIHLSIEQTDAGWLVVEFVGSFVMDRNRSGCSDRFEPWVLAPPFLNGPGRMLEFRIGSFDDVSNPRDMAEMLVGLLDRFSAERVLTTVSASPGAN